MSRYFNLSNLNGELLAQGFLSMLGTSKRKHVDGDETGLGHGPLPPYSSGTRSTRPCSNTSVLQYLDM